MAKLNFPPLNDADSDPINGFIWTDPNGQEWRYDSTIPAWKPLRPTVYDRPADYVSVTDFGAVGDGVTDDTAAIQAAFDFIKNQKDQTYYDGVNATASYHFSFKSKIVFPSGHTYRITDTINLTKFEYAHSYWYVEAGGAILKLEMNGKPAFDMLGARKCVWNGGMFISNGNNNTAKADLVKSCFQIGRTNDLFPSDSHRFNSLEIKGYFSWAPVYNYGSEDVYFDQVTLKNDYDDPDCYCIIQDGSNQWNVTSEFQPVAPINTPTSFLRNTFIRFDARKTMQGGAVWINSQAWQHQFISSYLVAHVDHAVKLYVSLNSVGNPIINFTNFEFDVHIETDNGDLDPTTGVQYGFVFDSPISINTNITVDGFKYSDNAAHYQKSLFKRSANISAVVFRDADLKLDVNRDVGQTIFDSPGQYIVSGNIQNFSTPATFGLGSSQFYGNYYCRNPIDQQSSSGLSSYNTITPYGSYVQEFSQKFGSPGNVFKEKYYDPSNTSTPYVETSVNTSNGNIVDIVNGTNTWVRSTAAFYPGEVSRDNTIQLGISQTRWSQVWAGTGTILTSDKRLKQDIEELSEAELRVATALKGLIRKYRFKDAVATKGDDARIHVGVIAQEVVAAFEAEGLDAMRYGIVCYDQWEDGEDWNAGDRFSVRYSELLAFIIAAL